MKTISSSMVVATEIHFMDLPLNQVNIIFLDVQSVSTGQYTIKLKCLVCYVNYESAYSSIDVVLGGFVCIICLKTQFRLMSDYYHNNSYLYNYIFVTVQVISMTNLEWGIQYLQVAMKQPWLIIFYNITNGITANEIKHMCTANDANNAGLITGEGITCTLNLNKNILIAPPQLALLLA